MNYAYNNTNNNIDNNNDEDNNKHYHNNSNINDKLPDISSSIERGRRVIDSMPNTSSSSSWLIRMLPSGSFNPATE
jgi:hypothetical protein